MAKAKQLPSGSWRIQAYDYTDESGKRHYVSFTSSDKKKGKKEVEKMALEFSLNKEEYRQKMKEIYYDVADGCIELQNKVGNYAKNRMAVYSKKEDEIRNILKEMPSSAEIKQMLSLVDLNIEEFYALYGEEKIHNAILYAKDLKDRYTILWLNYDLFGENKNVQ